MSGLDAIKTRFDSYAIAETADDAMRLTRGSESTIVLLVDYPKFKQDPNYQASSLADADSLRKKGLKFVVVANKINDTEDTPSSVKSTLARRFPTVATYAYDSAPSVFDRLPTPSGEIARQAIFSFSQLKAGKPFDISKDQTTWLTRAGQTKSDMNKAKSDISSALTSPSNANPASVELTGPWGIGLKATGPVAFPFVVVVTFVLVFFTLSQLLPNVKDVFTQLVFLLAVFIGMAILAFVWLQSNKLVKSLGASAS